jgi:hypothetical protein
MKRPMRGARSGVRRRTLAADAIECLLSAILKSKLIEFARRSSAATIGG